MIRSLGVLLAALALVLAACSSTDDGESAGTTAGAGSTDSTPEDTTDGSVTDGSATDNSSGETTPAAPLTASWTGVSEDTIQVGFLAPDLELLLELGLIDLDRGDMQVVVDALVDDVNARGGINGRQLEGHLEYFNPVNATSANEACLKMTDDFEVFAVVGTFTGPTSSVNSCLNDVNETILIGGEPTPEDLTNSKAPWITDSMSAERRFVGDVELMHQAELFEGKIAVAKQVDEVAVADDIVIPALQDRGYEVSLEWTQDSPPGDAEAGRAVWAVFIEQLRADDIDTVVLVENTGSFGSNRLAAEGWEGNVLMVDTRQLIDSIGDLGQVEPSELDHVVGTGGASPAEQFALPASQRCVEIVEGAMDGLEVVSPDEVPEDGSDWATNIMRMCAPFHLFELAAQAAGPELTHDSFVAGAESLGEIDLSGRAFSSLGPGKLDASDSLRLMGFDPTLGETGGMTPAGDLQRVP